MKTSFSFVGAFCAASASLVSCTNIPEEKSSLPNVIFFIADDMTRDMMNFLEEGKDTNLSPNLDILASEGTILINQHVASPVCTPSRFNCLTGIYASRAENKDFLSKMEKSGGQAIVEWNTFITEKNKTIGQYLQEAGYFTGFVGKNHAIEVPDVYIPEDYFGDPEDPKIKMQLQSNADKFRKHFSLHGFDYAERIYDNNPNYIGLQKLAVHNLDWITEGGVDFLDQVDNKPFFLYFALTNPHGPIEIERSWGADRRITPLGILEKEPGVLPSKEAIENRLEKAGFNYSGNTLAAKGNVLHLDDALGALIQKLKETGQYENTIIIFFSDHGQAAKGTVYQGGTTSPSVIWKYGGFECGHINSEFISNIDFAPTILELAGIEIDPGNFDGKSFASSLQTNEHIEERCMYFEMGYSRGVRKGDWKYIALRYPENIRNLSLEERTELLNDFNARQKKQAKKIHHTNPELPYSHLQIIPGGGDAEQASINKYKAYYDADQLYDLSTDPDEQVNLADDPEYKEKLMEMQEELKVFLKQLPGSFADLKAVPK